MQFKTPRRVERRLQKFSGQFQPPPSLESAQEKPGEAPRAGLRRSRKSGRQFQSPLSLESARKKTAGQFRSPLSLGADVAPHVFHPMHSALAIVQRESLPPVETHGLETNVLSSREEATPEIATSAEATTSTASPSSMIGNHLIWVMALACGLAEANLVYAQPLLADMGRSFGVTIERIGLTNTLGLFGYAIGLFFIVPLTEKYNQRRLVLVMLSAAVLALACMAVAPIISVLIIASGGVGLASIIPELIIPFLARLASSNERGRVVGTVLFGLFIGTPLASILSGFVGKLFGWRAMYWLAAAIMVILAILLHRLLPDDRSAKKEVHYLQFLGSLWSLFRSEKVLQEVSILGIFVYGAFSAFWVTLSFSLDTPPFHYGSDVVGIFGLVGIVGALAALFVGKFTDYADARYANGAALGVTLLSFVVMWLAGQHLIGLIIGALLLSVGTQSNQVANEARIYSLHPEIWNRLNIIYIFMYCIGGSLGSGLGTLGWSIAQREGTYATACFMLIIALVFYILHSKRIKEEKKREFKIQNSAGQLTLEGM